LVGAFVAWAGWNWAGWRAIGALVPLVSGMGTIVSSAIVEVVLSFEPRDTLRSAKAIVTMLNVHAAGFGTAYSLRLTWERISSQTYVMESGIPSLLAGEKVFAELTWPAALAKSLPAQVRITLNYMNGFRQEIAVEQLAALTDDGLQLDGPPNYAWPSGWFDLEGLPTSRG
jgi:hypothetical protein